MNSETGGVALAFAGFVFLTLAFKGTWGNVWNALQGKNSKGPTAPGAQPIAYLGIAGTTSGGTPGSPPLPQSSGGGSPLGPGTSGSPAGLA